MTEILIDEDVYFCNATRSAAFRYVLGTCDLSAVKGKRGHGNGAIHKIDQKCHGTEGEGFYIASQPASACAKPGSQIDMHIPCQKKRVKTCT
jgi:hypothetical protein